MSELTAEMVQRGRAPSSPEAAQRRGIVREMHSVRERLTSNSRLERAFAFELLRLYAQYRASAGIPLVLLALALAAATANWVPVFDTALRCLGLILVITLKTSITRRFRDQASDGVSLGQWRSKFVLCEVLQSTAWTLLLPLNIPDARTFVLFGLTIVASVSTMLAATVPIAAFAALVPLTLATLSVLLHAHETDTIVLVAIAVGSQLFFAVLARRLYSSAVGTLLARAEKNTILAELEHAKANSDAARSHADEANLAKSRFLATMSHELRTPLNAILGFSEVMKNEIFGAHTASAYREYSTDIHDSGMHLLNLINEILDLSRIEAGRYELNEEPVLMACAVEEVVRMMSLRARGKGQTIRTLIDPALPRLWADERALRQIVLNILSNAVKFTPPSGFITVKVGWTSSGGQYLSIHDSGPGIPKEEISTVLDSFGRGSLAIKTAEQGSGLGLPILKGLVELHGGEFKLYSKLHKGTELIVTFPASRVMDTLSAVNLMRNKASPDANTPRRRSTDLPADDAPRAA